MVLTRNRVPGLIRKVEEILAKGGDEPLLEICRLLKEDVEHYDWVGFYLVDPHTSRELVLGPFAGEPTEHTRIAFGEGICGQAADTGKLFLIQDVMKETNYLSCSPNVRSEMVVPIFIGQKIVGELDIDSHKLHPFTKADSDLLEHVCRLVGPLLA
ncbi:MAG: GAF domain-containing protein [Thermoplasmatota archaeon]